MLNAVQATTASHHRHGAKSALGTLQSDQLEASNSHLNTLLPDQQMKLAFPLEPAHTHKFVHG